MRIEEHLDCCSAVSFETVKSLYESSHDDELLRRCRGCGAWWFYRMHEDMSFSGDDDVITTWCTRLTDAEAAALRDTEARPDLAFLETRSSIMADGNGVHRVSGQPSRPFPW